MNNLINKNKIYFYFFVLLTFILFIYGKELASYLDIKWVMKYPKHLVFPLAEYLSGFVKWLMDDANFIIFTLIINVIIRIYNLNNYEGNRLCLKKQSLVGY